MKKVKKILIFAVLILFSNNAMSDNNTTIYNHSLIDIDGNSIDLSVFKGKPLLLVNTASRCGFTPQYEGLQKLFTEYRKTDLTIIATTSNSFNQEYSSTEEIKKICLANYGVGFITSSPMNVKGEDAQLIIEDEGPGFNEKNIDKVKGEGAHPIYKWINKEYSKKPKWNFYKFLFDRDGFLVDSWSSITKPSSKKITNKIDKLI